MFKKCLLYVIVVLHFGVLIILINYPCLRNVLSTQKATEYRIWLVNKSTMDQCKEASEEVNVWQLGSFLLSGIMLGSSCQFLSLVNPCFAVWHAHCKLHKCYKESRPRWQRIQASLNHVLAVWVINPCTIFSNQTSASPEYHTVLSSRKTEPHWDWSQVRERKGRIPS